MSFLLVTKGESQTSPLWKPQEHISNWVLLIGNWVVMNSYNWRYIAHESTGIGQEDMPQLQDRTAQWSCSGHLQRGTSQAATGLSRSKY
jgi:hypothetical protein